MITRVVMPKLTDTMEEGVVVAWKKHEGETVDSGDILAEIETDKAVLDLESFGSGVLRKVLVPEGETVQAGKLIAVIGEQDDDIEATLAEISGDQPEPPQAQTDSAAVPPKKKAPQPSPAPIPAKSEMSDSGRKKESPKIKSDNSPERRIKASPRAKVLAKEQGIDWPVSKEAALKAGSLKPMFKDGWEHPRSSKGKHKTFP